MNGVELFLLGRRLMKLGERALPTEGIGEQSTSHRLVMIVAADIADHDVSSVRDITARTDFPQSQVSAAVERLRKAGAVTTETDPADRRRLLIRPNPDESARVAEVRSAGAETVLGEALGDVDSAETRRVMALLEELDELLSAPSSGVQRRA